MDVVVGPVDVLHEAIDHPVGLRQELGRVVAQDRQAAQLVGHMEDDRLLRLDSRPGHVPREDLGAVGPSHDVHLAGVAADAAGTEADLTEEQISGQAEERGEGDDRQPGQADRRLGLAPDDDRQHRQPHRPSQPGDQEGPWQHRLTPG